MATFDDPAMNQGEPRLAHEFGFYEPGGFPSGGGPGWGVWAFCAGTVGSDYDHRWDLEGCASPVAYSLLSGTLPNGLSLDNITGSQGHIHGTPTTAGTYSFTLRATNAYGTADQAFSITIAAAGIAGGAGQCLAY